MTNPKPSPDLFALGQKYFNHFTQEFAAYGIQTDPRLELRRGSGMLCYYSLEDGHIYLSVPELTSPVGKLQALFLRSLLGCETNDTLVAFFELFIPHVIAHELAHHYRHRYHQFGQSMWQEEQIANKLSVAVVKHRLSPAAKAQAKEFLRRAIDALSAKMEAKNIALDSYYSVLHALNVSGQINVADFENVEMIKAMFGVSEEELLGGSGQLSTELLQRLEHRDELIEEIDEQYTSDQIKYIYYHVGWLYLDLTSRETEYVDEFARNYLGLGQELLPAVESDPTLTPAAVQACYKAYQELQPRSEVAARYFYKRYRSLLLAKLNSIQLPVPGHAQRLQREATLILENWSDHESDTLNYLAQLAPPDLRLLFPHLIASQLDPELKVSANLPTATDQRLWQHVAHQIDDKAARYTLQRLAVLDQTDIYRPLPAGLLLEMARLFCQVNYAAGETVIWQDERNDDVYFLIEGKLEVLISRENRTEQVDLIEPGEMFGEVAFFTEDPRYATVRAVQPSRCFVLTDTDLQLFAFKHPAILMQMAGVLAKRLADMYQTSRKETV